MHMGRQSFASLAPEHCVRLWHHLAERLVIVLIAARIFVITEPVLLLIISMEIAVRVALELII